MKYTALVRFTAAVAIAVGFVGVAHAAPLRFAGTECVEPPAMHCPEKDCAGAMVTNQGSVIEPQTKRTYFLDYPCDLKQGEKVTVILDFHGGGSYGNWTRNYFPLMDYVKKYRLVVAVPNSPGGGWPERDDPYLQNIVTSIIDQVGPKNVKAFWLVGHSMGGAESRRIVCTDFFKNKVDGFLSLSGGRIGSPDPAPFNIPRQDDAIVAANAANRPASPPPGAGRSPGGPLAAASPPSGPPGMNEKVNLDCDFSFIFSGGGNEPSSITLPTNSDRADKYGCGERELKKEVVDTKGGYVYDSSRQQYGSDAWGRLPHGGTAKIRAYSKCKDGRIVADVTRIAKGHTEGYEPKITEELIKMMLAAKSGKIRDGS